MTPSTWTPPIVTRLKNLSNRIPLLWQITLTLPDHTPVLGFGLNPTPAAYLLSAPFFATSTNSYITSTQTHGTFTLDGAF